MEKCVLNLDLPSPFEQVNVDRDLFVPVARFDYYLNFTKRSTVELIEKDSNISIHNVTQLIKAFDRLFSITLESKVCAVKIALAYERTINIERPLKSEAEAE